MARSKQKQIEGQLTFNFNTDFSNYVVQSNALIAGRQTLSLNAAKLMRAVIMQIKPGDEKFKTYAISGAELAKMFGVTKGDLYKVAKKTVDEIVKNPIMIFDDQQEKFIAYPWVSMCAYDKGFQISINETLRPFLLGLKERYTQYALENILQMKSVYAIRIFELLQKDSLFKYLPKEGAYIEISVADIRVACDCEKTLERISNFKAKVLDVACREINENTLYRVSYECLKNGRTIEVIRFYINMAYH